MGHLARSAAVLETLCAQGHDARVWLRADEQGHALARMRGLPLVETPHAAGACVVIDAMSVPEADAALLARFDRRILISPVCDRADIATDVLVRSVSDRLRAQLAPGCRVTCDPRFAYATAAGLTPRKMGYDGPLSVGICLSGGAGQQPVDGLVRAAAGVAGVTDIFVIAPERPQPGEAGPALHWQAFSNDAWDFFAGCNVFVGGDGLMIAEAVAQGLPCLSITRPEALFKNRAFIEAGCIECCFHGDMPETALAAWLSNRPGLAEMHRAALAADASAGARALADHIARTSKQEEG
ncbi:hypothetical protein CKO19_00565 [Rhodovulum adriaticum]|nr:hypothetical protein [Rhodovulum adriaticum]